MTRDLGTDEAVRLAHLALRDYEDGVPWNMSVYTVAARDALRDWLDEPLPPTHRHLDGVEHQHDYSGTLDHHVKTGRGA